MATTEAGVSEAIAQLSTANLFSMDRQRPDYIIEAYEKEKEARERAEARLSRCEAAISQWAQCQSVRCDSSCKAASRRALLDIAKEKALSWREE